MSTQLPEATIATNMIVLRRDRAPRQHSLEQIEGEGAPRRIALDQAEIWLGRANDADVHVASQRVSRQHASLTRRGAEFVLRDNDSHNGVLLNGVKIHSAVLRDGDVIQVADNAFVYREG
jgi:two-component system, NtrC family, response regulator AtoC